MRKIIIGDMETRVRELLSEGLSHIKIASIINVSPATIDNFVKKSNIPLNNPRFEKDESFLEKVDTPAKAYFLGWIASDGNIEPKGYGIRLTIQEGDKDVLEVLQKELKTNKRLYLVKKRNERCQNQLRLQINSKKMVEDIIKLGITPKKTHCLKIPNIPEEYFKYFLRGFFEGDGHFKPVKKGRSAGLYLYTASKDFAFQMKEKIQTITGCIARIQIKREGTGGYTKDFYIIQCAGTQNCFSLMKWMYSGEEHLHLERKYNSFLNSLKNYQSFETRYREIYQLNDNLEVIKEWPSLASPAKELKFCRNRFAKLIKESGESNFYHKGYWWRRKLETKYGVKIQDDLNLTIRL